MAQPTLDDARELARWQPPLGVMSVYLAFDPGDRSGSWGTRLRSEVDRVVASTDGSHERRMAVRATAARLLRRYEDATHPPPLGEARFAEIAGKEGEERSWPTNAAAPRPGVTLGERPFVTPLIGVCCGARPHGVALLSAERVRLLERRDGDLVEVESWELSMTSLDWRERRSQRSADPARAQGANSSGRDQFNQRLEHNRARFLREVGRLAGERLKARGLPDALVFGTAEECDAFSEGLALYAVGTECVGDADLISAPLPAVADHVSAAAERVGQRRDRELVERVLGEADRGLPGALGPTSTAAALAEARVDHLFLDAAFGDAAEPLVHAALAGGAEVTIVNGAAGERLAAIGGVAGGLRY